MTGPQAAGGTSLPADEPRAGRVRPPVPRSARDAQPEETGHDSTPSEDTLRDVFEHAPLAVMTLLPDGAVATCNARARRVLAAPMLGRPLLDLVHDEDRAALTQALAALQPGGAPAQAECRLVHEDRTTWVALHLARLPARPDQRAAYVVHLEDIDARRAHEAELVRKAMYDPLTGLPNRALLRDHLELALARGERAATPTSVLFLDLDDFKTVNDRWGHLAADALLRELGARLAALLRPSDTAARFAGDEFVVVCEDTDAEQADGIRERLHRAVVAPFRLGAKTMEVTGSIGVATHLPADGSPSPEGLLQRADVAMYVTKVGRVTPAG